MNVPVVIHFHGLEKSDTVEALIREKCDRLAARFDRMTHCDVHVDALNRVNHKGKLVQVKVDVGIPGQKPVVASAEKEANQVQEAITEAVREAFAVARRQLDNMADMLSKRVRTERARRRPSPSVGTIEE